MPLDYTKAFEGPQQKRNSTKDQGTPGLLELAGKFKANKSAIFKRDPLDPAPLLEKFARFELPLAEMQEEVDAHQVTDEATSAKCAEMSAQARKLNNEIEKAYETEWEPYKKVGNAIRGCKNKIQDRLQKMVSALEKKNLTFLSDQRKKKLAEEQKAREEQARLQREADEKARKEREAAAEEARKKAETEGADKKTAEEAAAQAAAMVQAPPVIVFSVPSIATEHKTDSGSQKLKAETSWEVLDFSMLPPEAFAELETHGHCRDSSGKVKATPSWPHVWLRRQVAAGVKNIAGVRFFELERVVTRSR